jgi:hypothetical protein
MSKDAIDFLGWILFLISAVAFVVSGLRNGDTAGLVGAVFFLVACVIFLIPYLRRGGSVASDHRGPG